MASLIRRIAAFVSGEPPKPSAQRKHPVPPAPPARSTYAYLGRDRAVTVTRSGRILMLDTRDVGMTPHLALSGEWERNVEDTVVALLRPGAAVVEIGANHGYHTLAMAEAVGPQGLVHAFEPNPRLVPLLAASVALNGMSSRVTVHAKAAAAAPGEVALVVHPDHAGSGHLEVASGGVGYSERHMVEAVRIDDTAGRQLDSVQLIRLDCEGAEPLALRGAEALISRSPELVLVMEWSVPMMQARADMAEFVAWLQASGFCHAWRIEGDGRTPLEMSTLPQLPHSEIILSRRAV
ncbi:MAG TPA: FkbM family methyltransferase [Roseomonas sp.]|nr:FkbM family methyltransferase [Roseomonas sp.]